MSCSHDVQLDDPFERTKAGRPLLTVPGACEASSDFSEMVTWPYRVSTGKPELLNATDASGVPGGWCWP